MQMAKAGGNPAQQSTQATVPSPMQTQYISLQQRALSGRATGFKRPLCFPGVGSLARITWLSLMVVLINFEPSRRYATIVPVKLSLGRSSSTVVPTTIGLLGRHRGWLPLDKESPRSALRWGLPLSPGRSLHRCVAPPTWLVASQAHPRKHRYCTFLVA